MLTDNDFTASRRHRATALHHLAFGVSSTPRALQRPAPIVAVHADGPWITDADGNRFLDYALGYGPLILGHTPAPVLDAVRAVLAHGLRTASVHHGEAELAALIAVAIPGADLSAFVSTGTEAVALALRVARAATGRTRIVKFRANYHGWFDAVHVAHTPGNDGPGTRGQDPAAAASLVIVDWGDPAALDRALASAPPSSIAAILLEPAAINGGCFPPPPGFLQHARAAATRAGALLVFDEVITGFRMGMGGAQARYGVTPDLTILGKALGAGFPIAAVSGSRAAMAPLATGAVNHRGTYNGNPVSVAAAIAALRTLAAAGPPLFAAMQAHATALADHIATEAARLHLPVCAQACGPMLQIFVGPRHIHGIQDLAHIDRDATMALTGTLLRCGVQAIPRGLMYVSAVHGPPELDYARTALTQALATWGAGAATPTTAMIPPSIPEPPCTPPAA